MNDTFDILTLTAELSVDEGVRAFPYTDTKGYLSVGRGRNLTGKGLSADEIALLFANDVAACCRDMDRHIPWWRGLPADKQRVMLNLCFMGWGTFSQFVKFLDAMRAGVWSTAAAELVNSAWYGQVGERGPRVVQRLLANPTKP